MNDTEFDKDVRISMRAYLQRAEVRLSTMHRVASAFLGGAGLLVLFPIFFNEVIKGIIGSSGKGGPINPLYLILLSVPFFLSLIIPLYALYLLLRDLIHFYFVSHSPGYETTLFNPRFVLSGITFSPDESKDAKNKILERELSPDLIYFVLPFGEIQKAYYDEAIKSSDGKIFPKERLIKNLIREGVIKEIEDEDDKYLVNKNSVDQSILGKKDLERFNAAFGLAGVRDRDLISEVAKAEVSLVRHASGLRRLVLRYIKALLTFILTTLISFLILAFIHRLPELSVLIGGSFYFIWSILTPFCVRLPIRWLYKTANKNSENVVKRDIELVEFEHRVIVMCIISGVFSLSSIILYWLASDKI